MGGSHSDDYDHNNNDHIDNTYKDCIRPAFTSRDTKITCLHLIFQHFHHLKKFFSDSQNSDIRVEDILTSLVDQTGEHVFRDGQQGPVSVHFVALTTGPVQLLNAGLERSFRPGEAAMSHLGHELEVHLSTKQQHGQSLLRIFQGALGWECPVPQQGGSVG